PVLDSIDKIDGLDKYTVKFTLNERNAWFLDVLASTSPCILAKECVDKFGESADLASGVGTGPSLLERRDPNARRPYAAHPTSFARGVWVPHPAGPAAASEWSIPVDQLGPEGRKLYEFSTADAKRLLAEAGYPNGFKTQVETPGVAYGPDFMDLVQIIIKNWKAAGIDAELK